MDEDVDQWGWDELVPALQHMIAFPDAESARQDRILRRANELWFEEHDEGLARHYLCGGAHAARIMAKAQAEKARDAA
jgi:hypothetical protein